MTPEIIITGSFTLISGIIGGLIAIYAALISIKRQEFYRLRGLFKTALFDNIAKIKEESGHPARIVMDNPIVDNLAISVIAICPIWKRKKLQSKWNEYRYDKNIQEMIPNEYTSKGVYNSKKLIEERLHNLISLLN